MQIFMCVDGISDGVLVCRVSTCWQRQQLNMAGGCHVTGIGCDVAIWMTFFMSLHTGLVWMTSFMSFHTGFVWMEPTRWQ